MGDLIGGLQKVKFKYNKKISVGPLGPTLAIM
jgi:hypothetical protein